MIYIILAIKCAGKIPFHIWYYVLLLINIWYGYFLMLSTLIFCWRRRISRRQSEGYTGKVSPISLILAFIARSPALRNFSATYSAGDYRCRCNTAGGLYHFSLLARYISYFLGELLLIRFSRRHHYWRFLYAPCRPSRNCYAKSRRMPIVITYTLYILDTPASLCTFGLSM